MSTNIQSYIWKIIEKGEKDDDWPKKRYGASLIYLPDKNKYFLIGGRFDAYQNEIKNYELNINILKEIDNSIALQKKYQEKIESGEIYPQSEKNSNLQKACNAKYEYVFQHQPDFNEIEVYIYETEGDRSYWYKMPQKGFGPKSKSCHRCIYISPYIFLFGGVELGQKAENVSTDELYVLNTLTFDWKKISSQCSPTKRTDFQWVLINNYAYLYGGESSPDQKFYNDMWCFSFNQNNLFEPDNKTSLYVPNIWTELEQEGQNPGAIKAYAMEHYNGYLYLFGGINKKKQNSNRLYRFDLSKNYWELIRTKGNPPTERCFAEMALINRETLLIFGGSDGGSFDKNKNLYNDVYLFNIKESVWVTPVIGGTQPSPRMGFSLCCNYYKGNTNEIMILGGQTKDIPDINDKTKNYLKLFIITEEKYSKFYWTIRNVNYKEQQNDDNFLLEAEQQITDYKNKIQDLEIDTQAKEIANKKMKEEIEDHKRQFFKQHGFLNEESQSMEEQINKQETHKEMLKENFEIDKRITNLKRKLKIVMENKNEKTFDFFNETCSIFINYYDSIGKVIQTAGEEKINEEFNLENVKNNCVSKLYNLKKKLEEISNKEENINSELHRFKEYEMGYEEMFKKEINQYKINPNNLK